MRTASMLKPIVFVSFVVSLFAGSSALASEEAAKLMRDDADEYETIELSLQDAVAIGIASNLGIEVERHAPLIAQEEIEIAWGAYDPTLSAGYNLGNEESPGSSSLSPDTESTWNQGQAAVNGMLPYIGATFGVTVSGSRRTTTNRFETFDPRYDSSLGIEASIPLLRNLIWNQQWTQVKFSGTRYESEEENFRRALMQTVLELETIYWNTVATEEQLRVARKSLETSVALLDQTKIQYEVGVISRVDVVEAEAGVAARELEVIRASSRYRSSQDQLIDLVYGTRLVATSRLQVDTLSKTAQINDFVPEPEAAVTLAFQNRPDLRLAEKTIEGQEIQLKFAKSQRLPQLDLSGSYRTSGAPRGGQNGDCINFGSPNSNCAAGQSGNLGDSIEDWYGGDDGNRLEGFLTFSVPIGNVAPRHTVSRSRLELHRSETQLLRLQQSIILEVRNDVRLLESALQGIEAAERQRVAAAEQLRAERIRLEHGESTPFDVLLREEDLVSAEVSKINAVQVHRTAKADLDRAQGTILRTHNVVVEEARTLRNQADQERSAYDRLLNP